MYLLKVLKNYLKYSTFLVFSIVIFLTLSTTFWKRQLLIYKKDLARLASNISEILPPVTTEETKCEIPKYKNLAAVMDYLGDPSYNCSNLQNKGGDIFPNGLKFLSKAFYLDGQKYLCMDPNVNFNPKNCTVYSFGINNEWSFDDEMASLGCQVFSFDPTMGINDHRRSDRVQFYNLGVAGYTGTKIFGKYKSKVARLEDIMTRLGHSRRKLDYLKIDIEGGEIDVFNDLFETSPNILKSNIGQIAMEVHLVSGKPENSTKLWPQYWTMLHKLECLGFRLVNNDPNEASGYKYLYKGNKFLCCYELLFINTNLLSS